MTIWKVSWNIYFMGDRTELCLYFKDRVAAEEFMQSKKGSIISPITVI